MANNRLIFPHADGTIGVCTPVAEFLASLDGTMMKN